MFSIDLDCVIVYCVIVSIYPTYLYGCSVSTSSSPLILIYNNIDHNHRYNK